MLHKPFKTIDELLCFNNSTYVYQNFFKAQERFKQDRINNPLPYNGINDADNLEEEEKTIYKLTQDNEHNNDNNVKASQAKLAR